MRKQACNVAAFPEQLSVVAAGATLAGQPRWPASSNALWAQRLAWQADGGGDGGDVVVVVVLVAVVVAAGDGGGGVGGVGGVVVVVDVDAAVVVVVVVAVVVVVVVVVAAAVPLLPACSAVVVLHGSGSRHGTSGNCGVAPASFVNSENGKCGCMVTSCPRPYLLGKQCTCGRPLAILLGWHRGTARSCCA